MIRPNSLDELADALLARGANSRSAPALLREAYAAVSRELLSPADPDADVFPVAVAAVRASHPGAAQTHAVTSCRFN